MCLPLEVFEAARAVFTPSKPVRMRVSATDWAEGGLDVEQTIAFAQAQRAGLRFIDVSSAGLTPGQNIPIGPSYQVPFAEAIKRATRMPTIAWPSSPSRSRPRRSSPLVRPTWLRVRILYDPRWPWHARAELDTGDQKPKRQTLSQLKRLRNIVQNPTVAVAVDRYSDSEIVAE